MNTMYGVAPSPITTMASQGTENDRMMPVMSRKGIRSKRADTETMIRKVAHKGL